MYNKMSFGENLINLRRQKGWSQDDLANNLNISRQAISKWETDISKPDVDNLEIISKIFSVTIDNLLDNDLPNDKAVALDVKKKEKKEKTITIVKLMIIAVIILYAISVIYKFASLLVIVNGVQKYANLNNYHYVITTYDENGLVEKEECWFKDGVSKTVNTTYKDGVIAEQIDTSVNYNSHEGYIINLKDDTKSEINYEDYINFHEGYESGNQFYLKLPTDVRSIRVIKTLGKALYINNVGIKVSNIGIYLTLQDITVLMDKESLLPKSICIFNNKGYINLNYTLELDSVNELKI